MEVQGQGTCRAVFSAKTAGKNGLHYFLLVVFDVPGLETSTSAASWDDCRGSLLSLFYRTPWAWTDGSEVRSLATFLEDLSLVPSTYI